MRCGMTVLDREVGPGARSVGCGLGVREQNVMNSCKRGSDVNRSVLYTAFRPTAFMCATVSSSGHETGFSESGDMPGASSGATTGTAAMLGTRR